MSFMEDILTSNERVYLLHWSEIKNTFFSHLSCAFWISND